MPSEGKARASIFLSGSGTNARKILEFWKNNPTECQFEPTCVVTDRPERCSAREIAQEFDLPLIAHDIFDFYKNQELKNISLATEAGRQAREAWTAQLIKKLAKFPAEFGIFAGFIPLCNITDTLPCLNVHPGDLSVLDKNGQRILTGLHTVPVEYAVLRNMESMRTTVIVASAFSDTGAGMDEGTIIGLSPEVSIDYKKKTADEYQAIYNNRQPKITDELKSMASDNQEHLKVHGDWIVFPPAVNDFAKGIFALDENHQLVLNANGKWVPVEYIAYHSNHKEIFFKGE
jgi:folate-dependent phosphoribosylglycinamide formyltransferase PurN